jgi:hypothetical protein
MNVGVRIRRSARLMTWLRAIAGKSSPRNSRKVTDREHREYFEMF